MVLLSLFYSWGYQGTERLSNLSMVTQLVRVGATIWTAVGFRDWGTAEATYTCTCYTVLGISRQSRWHHPRRVWVAVTNLGWRFSIAIAPASLYRWKWDLMVVYICFLLITIKGQCLFINLLVILILLWIAYLYSLPMFQLGYFSFILMICSAVPVLWILIACL